MSEDHLDLPGADSVRTSSPVRHLDADDLAIGVSTSNVEEDEIWDDLRDALETLDEGGVQAAIATADETVSTGMDQEQFSNVHAIEHAARNAHSEAGSVLTHVLVRADQEYKPCGRCLQTILDYSEAATLRIEDDSEGGYREIVLDGSSLFDMLLETIGRGTGNGQEAGSNGATEVGDSDSLTIPSTPPVINVDVGEDAEVEFVRLNAPRYHLKYKKMHQTFCGTDLSNREWFSSTEEPDLLEPCKMCYGKSKIKSNAVRREELRAQLAERIEQVEGVNEDPSKFAAEELIAILESLPVDVSSNEARESELRNRLSKAVVDVEATLDSPRSFSLSEMEGLIDALDGEGTISQETHLFVCTSLGRVARIRLSYFELQRRGGKGQTGLSLYDDEMPIYTMRINPRNKIYCFTNTGQVYQIDAHHIPSVELGGSPSPLSELVNFNEGESFQAAVSCPSIQQEEFVVFGTRKGTVKRTNTEKFGNILSTGIRAIELEDNDQLEEVCLMHGGHHILMATKGGRAIRFEGNGVPSMGRAAGGVNGIGVYEGDEVVAMDTVDPGAPFDVLTVTEEGYGKRTEIEEYRTQTRDGRGLVDIETGDRNGPVAGVEMVTAEDSYVAMSSAGRTIYTSVDEVSILGRNTMGVNIIEVEDNDSLAELAMLPN